MRFTLLVLSILPWLGAAAEPDIYRCAQPDGTVAFQQTPCVEPADDSESESREEGVGPDAADGAADFVNPYDDPAELPEPPDPALPASQDRAECETRTRNAIDAIDLEMRAGYTKEKGQQYLAELLELTEQLRACKQL